ncbi:MAG: hypothetical protein NT164_00460 [Verrucomicrobiae bacterium]|nr:hypothetical protein [Verrucomicrobiae bacterium]
MMFSLTQREQVVILTLLGIFLIGLGVKKYRQATTVKNSLSITHHSLLSQ